MAKKNIGKAYIQILPTTVGIKKELTETFGKEGSAVSKSFGLSFAGGLKGVLVSSIGALGIGNMIASSLSAGGELQQNLGGTQAVFQDFASDIQNIAKTAYSDMGMSASDYMATANKMASLFKGSGLDIKTSMDLTSTAMQRAADVASVMGIDTASAMESIAGAAKGNFTMMDNLGVAMNATTLEAYALEKGLNFKWDTASNAEKATVAMQMFMDRTSDMAGNFQNEAKNTLTGSLGMLKSAFTDLLGNLSTGGDVTTAANNVATSVIAVMQNLTPAVIDIIKGVFPAFFTAIQEMLPEIIKFANSIVEQFNTNIIQRLPEFIDSGFKMLTSLINGILNNLPNIIKTVGDMINKMINFIFNNLPLFLQKGIEFVKNMVNGIISALPNIISSILQVVTSLITNIGSRLPEFLSKGIQMLGELGAGLIQAIPNLVSKVPGICNNVISAFQSIDWGSIGSNIISGIANGLWRGINSVVEAAKNVASKAFNAAKEFLDIHSPSKKFMWIGKMSTEGLSEGIENSSQLINDSMKKITDDMLGITEKDLSLNFNGGSFNIPKNYQPLGFNQTINIYSPKELSASEVARQTKNSTRQLALALQLRGGN